MDLLVVQELREETIRLSVDRRKISNISTSSGVGNFKNCTSLGVGNLLKLYQLGGRQFFNCTCSGVGHFLKLYQLGGRQFCNYTCLEREAIFSTVSARGQEIFITVPGQG